MDTPAVNYALATLLSSIKNTFAGADSSLILVYDSDKFTSLVKAFAFVRMAFCVRGRRL